MPRLPSILLALLVTCSAAADTCQQKLDAANAKNEALQARIAALKDQVKALTPPPPKPVQMQRVVLQDGDGLFTIIYQNDFDADQDGKVETNALVAKLQSLPPSIKWVAFDVEHPWLDYPIATVPSHDWKRLFDIGHAIRPDIKFGVYGCPVTECDPADDMPGGWHSLPWRDVLAGADWLCPSIYQGASTADPACVRISVGWTLGHVADGRPVLPFATARYKPDGGPLVAQAEIERHVAAVNDPVAVLGAAPDKADGLVAWNRDLDFRPSLIGEVPAGWEFNAYCDAQRVRNLAIMRKAVLGTGEAIPPAPAPITPPVPPASQPDVTHATNVPIGGAFGAFNLTTGGPWYITNETHSAQRGISGENDQHPTSVTVASSTIGGVDYGFYANNLDLFTLKNSTIKSAGGGNSYGVRAVVKTIDWSDSTIDNSGGGKACIRLAGVMSGQMLHVNVNGRKIQFGGGVESETSSPTEFCNVTISGGEWEYVSDPNPNFIEAFPLSHDVTFDHQRFTIPEGKFVFGAWFDKGTRNYKFTGCEVRRPGGVWRPMNWNDIKDGDTKKAAMQAVGIAIN